MFNNDVDVKFKLLIDNVEFVDNEFKLLKIVVDVALKLFIAVKNTEFDVVKLANIVVETAFKLLIDNVELVDNEFKWVNNVVDVAFKLLIDNIEFVDRLFKFVNVELPVKEFIIFNNDVEVAFILLIDKIDDVDKLLIFVFKVAVESAKLVIDVVWLLILKIEFVDRLFKLAFVPLIFK